MRCTGKTERKMSRAKSAHVAGTGMMKEKSKDETELENAKYDKDLTSAAPGRLLQVRRSGALTLSAVASSSPFRPPLSAFMDLPTPPWSVQCAGNTIAQCTVDAMSSLKHGQFGPNFQAGDPNNARAGVALQGTSLELVPPPPAPQDPVLARLHGECKSSSIHLQAKPLENPGPVQGATPPIRGHGDTQLL
ncbi:hypothetical protein BGY98DRAFT_935934 [Russula aff. rugulosa BPL654]|nr:hypothetical protein BGY98DRAFT_935934 [Russula aff. rugulosa BPL654]